MILLCMAVFLVIEIGQASHDFVIKILTMTTAPLLLSFGVLQGIMLRIEGLTWLTLCLCGLSLEMDKILAAVAMDPSTYMRYDSKTRLYTYPSATL